MKTKLLKMVAPIAKHFPKQIRAYRYKKWTNKSVDWKNPRDFQQYIFVEYFKKHKNGELQLLADLTDKYKVREFVKERIGEEYLTKLYGVWEKPEDIDFSNLPEKFVLKTNNGCATNIIIRDKAKELNEKEVCNKLKGWLSFPYGDLSGQIHYSLIKPLIIAESFLEQNKGDDSLPWDYKFYCFNGEPKFICVYEGRRINEHLTYIMGFDLDWNSMPDKVLRPSPHNIPRPESLKELTEVARKLSQGFDFVRVDLYEIDGHPIFGEMTFTPDMANTWVPEFLDMNNFKKFL